MVIAFYLLACHKKDNVCYSKPRNCFEWPITNQPNATATKSHSELFAFANNYFGGKNNTLVQFGYNEHKIYEIPDMERIITFDFGSKRSHALQKGKWRSLTPHEK